MIDFNTLIENLGRLGKSLAPRLKKLGLVTAEDLLFYFPFRYDDFSKIADIAELKPDTQATVRGQILMIENHRSWRKKMFITEALINDVSGTVKIIWFNQPFIGKILKTGDEVFLSGKIEYSKWGLQMTNPVYEKAGLNNDTTHTARLVPIYPLTGAMTNKQIRTLIKIVIPLAKKIEDFLPEQIKKNQKLLGLASAIQKIHFPDSERDMANAKKRLAFDELFLIQLKNQVSRQELKQEQAPQIKFHQEKIKKFVDALPFKLTEAQRKASWEIIQDLGKNQPMSRLLEGDVGSGKTVVAAMAAYNTALDGWQTVILAPTEILACQHYETIKNLLTNCPVSIALWTRTQKQSQPADLITKNKLPETAQIIIGTHALLQEKVEFNKLGLIVVDEQHRFGVRQRSTLATRTYTDYTQTDTDSQSSLLYEDLTYKIRGAIFTVKKQSGLGHKENIYQKALEEEFSKNKLFFEKEKSINITYNNKKIGIYRPDFVIENKIILEIKSLPSIGKFEKQQIWHYLKGSEYKLALLVNFGRDDIKIERFIYTSGQPVLNPYGSVSSPYMSVLVPHLLSMSATPIPRTLALTLYSDLDLSIIDELPKERLPIKTYLVPPEKRKGAYGFIRKEIEKGRQVFVVCPLIDPSDKLGVKAAEEEYEKLTKDVFPDLKIGLLHGRIKKDQKEKIRQELLENEINVLVATSVIEVGVDVPNATVMMIEGAERFGLAQLYQLRGRVGRSNHQSWCFLFTDNLSEKTKERLMAVVKARNGFELAEKDLALRGPGEIFGTQQTGWPELKFASLADQKLISETKKEAGNLLQTDPELDYHPLLKEKVSFGEKIHLE